MAKDLAAFAGTYRSEEAETVLVVKVEGDELVVLRRPGSRAVLRPRAADTFEGAAGTMVFRRNSAGQVTELSIVQDRVWDLRFPRHAPAGGSSDF
jgi:uncharacterized protein DUF3471